MVASGVTATASDATSVRYDSPSFGGFSVSASWGEDDFWDVAARYAGEWADFKIAAAGAFSHVSDANVRRSDLDQPQYGATRG